MFPCNDYMGNEGHGPGSPPTEYALERSVSGLIAVVLVISKYKSKK